MKFVRGTMSILFFILLSGNLCAYVYYVKEGGSGSGTGVDWDNALPSIQSAIDLADVSATGDTIYVAEGTYEEHLVLVSDINLWGGYPATATGVAVTPRDLTAHPVVIDGTRTGRPVTIDGIMNIELNGFVIRNGTTHEAGGGILTQDSVNIGIIDNTIENNESIDDWGGGIAVIRSSSVFVALNIIRYNDTNTSGGGVSFWQCRSGVPDSLSITENTISGNTAGEDSSPATTGRGGGIMIDDCDSVDINDNTISDNTASNMGGGIMIVGATCNIRNSTIEDNTATNLSGGGICVQETDAPGMMILRNTIASNTSGDGGDGIHIEISTSLVPQIGGRLATCNHIHSNGEFDLYYIGTDTLMAFLNDWGTMDEAAITARISGPVLFDPWVDPACTSGPPGHIGPLDHIIVRDAPDGGGTALVDRFHPGGGYTIHVHHMTVDETFQVWAAGYDAFGNFISDIPVTWTVTTSCWWRDCSIPADVYTDTGVTTIFDPTNIGSAYILADDGAGHTMLLDAGVYPDHIMIRSAPNGEGGEVTTRTVGIGWTLHLWAAGYDAAGTFLADVPVYWDSAGDIEMPWHFVRGGYVGTRTTLETDHFDPGTTSTGTIEAVIMQVDGTEGSQTDTTGTITITGGDTDVSILYVTTPSGAHESDDIWFDNPCNGWWEVGDPMIDEAVSTGTGLANRIYARVRNAGDNPAVNIAVRFFATDYITPGMPAPDIDPNKDGITWDRIGEFGSLLSSFTDVHVVVHPDYPGVTDDDGDGKPDILLPGCEAVVYTEWEPSSPSDPDVYRTIGIGVDSQNREVSWRNNIGQDNIYDFRDDDCDTMPIPGFYIPGMRFYREISFNNPDYPEEASIEIHLDLANWPDDWTAELSQTKIQFEKYELSRDVTLTMTYSPSAKPGDSGTLVVSVWLQGENEPRESFPVVVEVPQPRDWYGDLSVSIPYPLEEPFNYEIPFNNPYYPQGGDIELRLDSVNWPGGWTAELSQTKIQFGENELYRDVMLTMAYLPDAKLGDTGTLGISIWLPGGDNALESFSVVGEVTEEAIAARTLSITSAKASPGDQATVQLNITDAAGVAGGDVLVEYDANVLTVGEVRLTELTSDMLLSVNKDVPGEIRLSIARMQETPSGSGALVEIELAVSEDAEVGTQTLLELDIDTEIYNESGVVVPVSLENGVMEIAEPGIRGDVSNDGQVSSTDAILTLRIAAGLITASGYQQWAADMNGDGKIKSNDAIAILRKAVGLAAPGKDVPAGASRQITITVAEAHGIAGERLTVPLRVDNIKALAGGDIWIVYDSAVLRAVDVSSGPGMLLVSNVAEPGMVRIAFACADRLSSKALAEIQFDVLADDVSSMEFQRVDLYGPNGLPLSSRGIDQIFRSWAMPAECDALLQNYPNPFNPETWIPYQLKEGHEVAIRIYSAAGELVRELKLGYKPAGLYVSQDRAAYWDGRNRLGMDVASGVYFYSIHADGFSAVRKLTILK